MLNGLFLFLYAMPDCFHTRLTNVSLLYSWITRYGDAFQNLAGSTMVSVDVPSAFFSMV